jgi:hypothetical protein
MLHAPAFASHSSSRNQENCDVSFNFILIPQIMTLLLVLMCVRKSRSKASKLMCLKEEGFQVKPGLPTYQGDEDAEHSDTKDSILTYMKAHNEQVQLTHTQQL